MWAISAKTWRRKLTFELKTPRRPRSFVVNGPGPQLVCNDTVASMWLIWHWYLLFHCIYLGVSNSDLKDCLSNNAILFMDNSGKVWLIHTRMLTYTNSGTQWLIISVYRVSRYIVWVIKRNMRNIEHANVSQFLWDCFTLVAELILRSYFVKHVIQASTASSHRVGKCIFEPSKQSRIRKSSFWSHRRSTVQWETALSSKERSRRVNCPMTVPYKFYLI